MGAIGGLLGTAGGQSGTGVSGPNGNQFQSPVTQDQIQGSQIGADQSLGSQRGLLSALLQNNGVGNQNAAWSQGQGALTSLNGLNGTGNIKAAESGLGSLAGQLGNAGGVGDQTAAAKGLQGVLQQQQAVANGTGPNPAQAMLNQATGQNVANQAALMAGQRGAGANVGLMARQAAQQGAATQQQAAGQAATMQAQQQLNALGAMTGTSQALAGVGAGLTGQQQGALGAQGALGQGSVQLGQAQQGINAGIAQNQIGNLAGVAQQSVQGNLANAGQILGAQGQNNATNAGIQTNVNTANAGLAGTAMQGQQGLLGGGLNAAGGAATAALGARGGEVQRMADGGQMAPAAPAVAAPAVQGPQSTFGQFLKAAGSDPFQMGGNLNPGAQQLQKGMGSFGKGVGTAVSNYLNQPTGQNLTGGDASSLPTDTAVAARGGLANKGGHVAAKKPGQKAVKSGNSYDNDKIPAMLSEGEIVIPRSVMQSKDPARGAADFVAKCLAKRGRK